MNNDYLDQSNSIITEILKQVTSSVNDRWDSITASARFEEGIVEFNPSYLKDGVKSSILIPGSDIPDLLSKLKELNSSNEKGSLKGLVFKIAPDGNFAIDYEY